MVTNKPQMGLLHIVTSQRLLNKSFNRLPVVHSGLEKEHYLTFCRPVPHLGLTLILTVC